MQLDDAQAIIRAVFDEHVAGGLTARRWMELHGTVVRASRRARLLVSEFVLDRLECGATAREYRVLRMLADTHLTDALWASVDATLEHARVALVEALIDALAARGGAPALGRDAVDLRCALVRCDGVSSPDLGTHVLEDVAELVVSKLASVRALASTNKANRRFCTQLALRRNPRARSVASADGTYLFYVHT